VKTKKISEPEIVWTWKEWMDSRARRGELSQAVAGKGKARRSINPSQDKLKARLARRSTATR
jgi:hypothetical protein